MRKSFYGLCGIGQLRDAAQSHRGQSLRLFKPQSYAYQVAALGKWRLCTLLEGLEQGTFLAPKGKENEMSWCDHN